MQMPIESLPSTVKQQDFTESKAIKKVDELSPVAQQKSALNVAIMESAKVSIGSKDNSLTLLFNTAIDKINEQLAPELGEDAIQKGYDSGLDISPEATAERIVSLSTLSYQSYKENNPDENDKTQLDNYIDLISSGIEQGFGEARIILDGLGVLEGDIASNIDKTYELAQEKLAIFKALMSEQFASTEVDAKDQNESV